MAESGLSISVAMCTYNGGEFLREQLASIARQTCLPDELVICDDDSTDTTSQIVEEFTRSVSFPVRFIRNPHNLGTTKNFEKAIGLCTGDLIALSDQDDIWMPERLARQAEMLERDPALGGVFSDAELMDATSTLIGKRLWANIFFLPADQMRFRTGRATDELLKRMVATGATMMVRASLRPLFTPIPAIWVHDCWIAWMLTVYSKFAPMEEPLIQYRLHPAQQIGIESLGPARSLPLRKRLEIGQRQESKKSLLAALWFEELERHLNSVPGPNNRALLASLRRRINFYKHRGQPYPNKLRRIGCIIRNARNYCTYEHGLKGMVWDIVVIFI